MDPHINSAKYMNIIQHGAAMVNAGGGPQTVQTACIDGVCVVKSTVKKDFDHHVRETNYVKSSDFQKKCIEL